MASSKMEILIQVPEILWPYLQRLHSWWMWVSLGWNAAVDILMEGMAQIEQVWHTAQLLWYEYQHQQRQLSQTQHSQILDPSFITTTTAPNKTTILSVIAAILLLWPLAITLVMAMAAAWAWIFWLFASVVLGLLQVCFATYQFCMIAGDIVGLSMLKTYSLIRRYLLNSIENIYYSLWSTSSPTSSREANAMQSKNARRRRRHWRQCLEQAHNYEEFLKIPIEPKDYKDDSRFLGTAARIDSALPPWPSKSTQQQQKQKSDHLAEEVRAIGISRSQSFQNSVPQTSPPRRNWSFSGGEPTVASIIQQNPQASRLPLLDPAVAEELGGPVVANLLVTTTERLEQARQAVESLVARGSGGGDGVADPNDARALQYLLSAVVKRNHLTLEDVAIHNARCIAVSGRYGLSYPARQVIRKYYDEVERCLDVLADAPAVMIHNNNNQNFINSNHLHGPFHHGRNPMSGAAGGVGGSGLSSAWNQGSDESIAPPLPPSLSSTPAQPTQSQPLLTTTAQQHDDLSDRITLVRKMKQNIGRTALMLSGGGAQGMYHFGVIRALIESKLYDKIKVISGTSGGSIVAAICAIQPADEMYHNVCVPTVSTDYPLGTGEMKRQNIRWFPSVWEMGTYWLKHKLLVDSAYFRRTCDYYFGDYTFEEAFERTGKHVCITVSASRASGSTVQRLLLNHISTPHVTIASAVAASCALPGVMAPAKLLSKSSTGVLEPFEIDGVEWIDGSVQADLPFQRISTLFAVTSFIVSQTNFHIVPFMNKAHHPHQNSLYWRLFQTLEWDIRSRALNLSRLGLFPRIFGQDISNVFKQRYHGNLTIVPRFTTMQTFGLKALSNPTVKDMEGYLKYGQIAVWPYLNAIRTMIRLETALDDCLARLEERVRALHPDTDWYAPDDVESIASGSIMAATTTSMSISASASHQARAVRILGRPSIIVSGPSSSSQQQRLNALERENELLRQQLKQLHDKLREKGIDVVANGLVVTKDGITSNTKLNGSNNNRDDSKGNKEKNTSVKSLSDGSEGNIWNMVLQKLKG